MNLWGWVIVYIIGLSLLQVLIHRYLSEDRAGERSGDSADGPIDRAAALRDPLHAESDPTVGDHSRTDPTPSSEATPSSQSSGTNPSAVRHCPRCGTPNAPDSTYTYCQRCIKPLG